MKIWIVGEACKLKKIKNSEKYVIELSFVGHSTSFGLFKFVDIHIKIKPIEYIYQRRAASFALYKSIES